VLEVITQLRAAKRVRQCIDAIHSTFEPFSSNFSDTPRGARNTADRA
jgi:hypothetical protein